MSWLSPDVVVACNNLGGPPARSMLNRWPSSPTGAVFLARLPIPLDIANPSWHTAPMTTTDPIAIAYAAGAKAARATRADDARRAATIAKFNANSASGRPIRHDFDGTDQVVMDVFQSALVDSPYALFGKTQDSYDVAMAFRRGFFASDDV